MILIIVTFCGWEEGATDVACVWQFCVITIVSFVTRPINIFRLIHQDARPVEDLTRSQLPQTEHRSFQQTLQTL
jgi:hypothetical protein